MLYLVATPIGNLGDITHRALDLLGEADTIVCEDTRRTQKLLNHYRVRRKDGTVPSLVSFHEHSGPGRLRQILEELGQGKSVALVSDSGVPLISDPGFELVREVIRRGIRVEALPGPSALLTALVLSGLAVDRFSFFGFLPQKSAARRKALSEIKDYRETLIFYESPFRLIRTLEDMKETFGDREACVARELTKKFEEIVRGYLSEIIEKFSIRKILGEMVILVAGKGRKETLH
ncbi:MAG: 16S rRNA (cytidine(1402)-2'-O)-methyltransferase [Candidatus Omnitrophica bacterium]|nr:16S rRNA (cytidine(1402)-2'-O)-methyltransferase [Candidatus Omnitrophota bacterium]